VIAPFVGCPAASSGGGQEPPPIARARGGEQVGKTPPGRLLGSRQQAVAFARHCCLQLRQLHCGIVWLASCLSWSRVSQLDKRVCQLLLARSFQFSAPAEREKRQHSHELSIRERERETSQPGCGQVSSPALLLLLLTLRLAWPPPWPWPN